MNWIILNKDVLALLIASGSLVVSIIALIRANKTASLAALRERSSLLEELHDKIRPGRKAMKKIWRAWCDGVEKRVEQLSQADEEQFIAFYNNEYHNSSDEEKLALSDRVHTYLHELHHAWDRVESGEFDLEAVMRRLGHGIRHDKHFLILYLNAHWQKHNQFQEKVENRFWCNIPKIVKAA